MSSQLPVVEGELLRIPSEELCIVQSIRHYYSLTLPKGPGKSLLDFSSSFPCPTSANLTAPPKSRPFLISAHCIASDNTGNNFFFSISTCSKTGVLWGNQGSPQAMGKAPAWGQKCVRIRSAVSLWHPPDRPTAVLGAFPSCRQPVTTNVDRCCVVVTRLLCSQGLDDWLQVSAQRST